jgi:hypothetical protein
VEPEVLTPEQAEARRHAKSSVEVQAGVDENLIEGANAPHNPDADDGLAQPNPVDAQAVVEIADAPVWRKFDLGTSLQLLRSTRPGVVRRALRKLHIRWYHAPSRRMATFLTAAGVSSGIVALVPDIVSTCEICRAWSRPGPRSMTSTRLPEKFNLEVEIDLLFVGTHVVLHMVDRCIRWTVAVELANRTTDEILSGIREGWVSRFGAPTVLISDQEGGLNEYAGAILEQLGIKLELKAKGQHAPMVERHNELLRRQLHLIDSQATSDGLRVSFPQILQEAVFAKNVLLQYGGFSPFEALYGRTPPLLDVMHHEDNLEIEDPSKLRATAIQSIIRATAEDRLRRAANTKTRPAGELRNLEVGDLVDIHRSNFNKDISRWHGPATVTDLTSLKDGMISVKWQGKIFQVRVRDCRRALTYFAVPMLFGDSLSPIEILRHAAETFVGAMRVGWLKKNGTWKMKSFIMF